MIGVLRWIVELMRGELHVEVPDVASTMALPCEGHFSVLLKTFSLLKSNHNGVVVFGPTETEMD